MRRRWALLGLLAIPLSDAALLVVVADVLGWVTTVAVVVLTGLLGMLLVRAEGRHTLRAIPETVRRGEVPTDELIDGGLLIVAGAFFLTPGLVTDALGVVLALPLTRYPVRVALREYVVEPYVDARLDDLAGGVSVGSVAASTGGAGSGGDGPTAASGSPAGDTVDLGPDDYRVDDEGPD